MSTIKDLEAQVNTLAEMCANYAKYLRESQEVNAKLVEALEYARTILAGHSWNDGGAVAKADAALKLAKGVV